MFSLSGSGRIFTSSTNHQTPVNPELLQVIRDAELSKEEDLKAVKEVIADESAAGRESDAVSKEVLEFIRDIAYNWDCDEDSHKYNTTCRKCSASELYYDLTKQQKEK